MRVPAISTLELTNACNFGCSYCQRYNDDGERKSGMINIQLIRDMIERGDFDSTFYLELQLSGEPTLHPQFTEIVKLLKNAVPCIGMSTNASFMDWKHEPIEGVKLLDAITISVHPESNSEDIARVMNAIGHNGPTVRLQTIGGNWHNIGEDYWRKIDGFLDYLTIDDYPLREWGKDYGEHSFCSDLKGSVSVNYSGVVMKCCNAYTKEGEIGNLNNDKLEDIWKNSDKGFMKYCSTCATPSPYTRRLNFFTTQMESRK